MQHKNYPSPQFFFSLSISLPCKNKLKNPNNPICFEDPEKRVSIRLDQGSHCHLCAGFFTGLLETGFEDKQGEYVKPLLTEH